VERVQLPNPKSDITFGRRLKSIVEVTDYEEYRTISTWNPLTDSFQVDFKNSEQLAKVALRHGLNLKDVLEEIERRALFLHDLKVKGIRKNVEMAKFITNYYLEAKFPRVPERHGKKAEE
jgi:flagellar protein FlaI